MARAKCYHTMDAFVKLVVVLVRYSGDATNTITKVNLLNKVSGDLVRYTGDLVTVLKASSIALPSFQSSVSECIVTCLSSLY